VGVVYSLREGDRPTVVRAKAGLYYEQPLDIYRRAILNSGNRVFFHSLHFPTQAGAPAFPNTLGSLPAGTTLPPEHRSRTPDYETSLPSTPPSATRTSPSASLRHLRFINCAARIFPFTAPSMLTRRVFSRRRSSGFLVQP